jgi:hypothetical protein
MFKWLKRGREPERTVPDALSMPESIKAYAEAVIKKTDANFAKNWPFDPNWIGLISVATELDQIASTTDRMDKILEQIAAAYSNGESVSFAATLMVLTHMKNQRELEDIIRQSNISRRQQRNSD